MRQLLLLCSVLLSFNSAAIAAHTITAGDVCAKVSSFWAGSAEVGAQCSAVIGDGYFDPNALRVCWEVAGFWAGRDTAALSCIKEIKNNQYQSFDQISICYQLGGFWAGSADKANECLRAAAHVSK